MNAELSGVQGDANHASKCGRLVGFLVCDLSFSERIWGLSAASSHLFLQSTDQNKEVSLKSSQMPTSLAPRRLCERARPSLTQLISIWLETRENKQEKRRREAPTYLTSQRASKRHH